MNKHGKFDAAKTVLAEQIREARPGDVISVIAFDSNDYPIGRIDVGEDGSPEAKEKLVAKIRGLKARGRYTNLDEPLQAAKAFLLEERAPGTRKIILLSDGLSDPSPDHTKLDLKGIAEMIPQELGWAVYMVGLPDDIAGLFQTSPQDTGIVLAPENQHIKGIVLERFSREKIHEAVTVAKQDVNPVPTLPPAVTLPTPVPEPVSSPPVETSRPLVMGQESTEKHQEPRAVPLAPPWTPLVWLLGAVALAVIGAVPLMLRRRGTPAVPSFTFDVKEGEEEAKRLLLTFDGKGKKTIGPRGDLSLGENTELPPIIGMLYWSKGRLWLTPMDTITVNGRPITTKTVVGPGDLIRVREHTRMTIAQGGENAR